MTALTLVLASALLFWVNLRTKRQPAKAITYLGAWALIVAALVVLIVTVAL